MLCTFFMQVDDASAKEPHNKRCRTTAITTSTISTRSRATEDTANGASDMDVNREEGSTPDDTTPTRNLTSRGSNSPDENAIVTSERQGIYVLYFCCFYLCYMLVNIREYVRCTNV